MGLDQYAYCIKNFTNDEDKLEENSEEIGYWRKHPNLEGWMENLYYQKGGNEAEFNCVNLWLNEEDILQLRKDIEDNNLPEHSGFFFGKSDGREKDGDISFCNHALELIKKGYKIYYTSSW